MGETEELHLYGDIGAAYGPDGITAKAVMTQLSAVKKRGAKEVTIGINSPGGDATEGIAIHNAIRRCGMRVICRVDSLAASAASVVAMAGDRVVMEPNALLMMHRAWLIASGNADDMTKAADVLKMMDETIASIYSARTGKPVTELLKLMSAELWLNATEAKAGHWIDEILQPSKAHPATPAPENRGRRSASQKMLDDVRRRITTHSGARR